MSEFIVTDFEWNEQVFVPAGDGEPAGWKLMRDLTVGEFGRHSQGRTDAADRQAERVRLQTRNVVPLFSSPACLHGGCRSFTCASI